jgi:endonuclease/exonuclease/phosphatase family metal-dependent hydrolase
MLTGRRRVAVLCVLLFSARLGAAPPPPAAVTSPSPASGASAVSVTTPLSWAASSRAQRYDVYFGLTSSPPLVSADQTATSYQPATLAAATTYFWRVDAKNASGTTRGSTWSFATAAAAAAPGAPSNPSPTSGAGNVPTASTILSWAPAGGADNYDVALGLTTSPPVIAQAQSGTSFNPGALAAGSTYYWQVTANNSTGSTVGPLWQFTTADASSPIPSTNLSRLKILTWNIQHGYDAANVGAIDEQVALMVDSNADVITLQEITIEPSSDLRTEYEARLEAVTGRAWNSVWAPAPRPAGVTPEGDLILTRLPIVSSSVAAWDTQPNDPGNLGSKRAAAQVQLLVNGRSVNVIVTHLDTDVTNRTQQLSLLLQFANQFASPRIIGGDFNMMPSEADHATMAAQFPDAWNTLVDPYQSSPEPGYTKDARGIAPWTGQPGRIDYWFHEKTDTSAVPTEISVLKTRRSDHNALLVLVAVK